MIGLARVMKLELSYVEIIGYLLTLHTYVYLVRIDVNNNVIELLRFLTVPYTSSLLVGHVVECVYRVNCRIYLLARRYAI
ncbi:hypothetical protein F5B22DRAFT_482575 [Xylaria bambusicola]|uniref:uncharacterized protein n=1 Tax=Xylaria bambusicola TaxID=326684 RepID=UPI00200831ED|nr:uncharacterized protein F5B22DRAFT_482575 [Xylaria bambusicola]KAI0506065.1 hypothetical protein F5B22DRAFT_482575 [Xylaria bambusicola]